MNRKKYEPRKKGLKITNYSQTSIKGSFDEFLSLKKSVVNQKKALRKWLENNKKYSQTSIKNSWDEEAGWK